MMKIKVKTYYYLAFFIFLFTCMSGCSSSNITLVSDYYYVPPPEKLVDQPNIGSEWSKQHGATKEGILGEEKIERLRSVNRLDKGVVRQLALGIAAKLPTGPGLESDIESELNKGINISNLQIIRPIALADIEFKPGIIYVTEALRVRGFDIDSKSKFGFKVQATVGVEALDASLGGGIGTKKENTAGMGGEGLVIAYKLETLEKKTLEKAATAPIQIVLAKRVEIDDISVIASLEKVVSGSGKPLPARLIWACDQAESKKKELMAAWVVNLSISGKEKKRLSIAFPAFPEIQNCSEYEDIITAGINSQTDKIERKKIKIFVDKAKLSESLDPIEFAASVSTVTESFKIKTVKPNDLK